MWRVEELLWKMEPPCFRIGTAMPATARKRIVKPLKHETVEVRIAKHARARALGKRHYERADRLLDTLIKELPVGEAVPLPGGKKAVLKDLFAEKTKVFRAHGIGRYEVEISEAE
jgi:hypothetical protein